MKKLIIVTIIAAFFAACNNKPAENESTAKNASLKNWVDSVGKLAKEATTCDSAQWALWNTDYESAVAGVNEADLDEANKATLAESKTKWSEAGAAYSACVAKTKADEAAKAMQMKDSTAVAPVPPVEVKK